MHGAELEKHSKNTIGDTLLIVEFMIICFLELLSNLFICWICPCLILTALHDAFAKN